jgi:RNA polymerase sigma-70 factor (ECF subfamily)
MGTGGAEPSTATPGRLDPQRHARDLDFVRQLLAGDETALSTLRERLACIPAMVRHHNRRLGRPLDALEVEDAVHDTVAAVWGKLPTFAGRSTLDTWVYRFAMLEVLKGAQRKRRGPRSLEDCSLIEDPRAADDDGDGVRFEAHELRASLDTLSVAAAEVVRLRHFEGLGFEQIAAAVGTPVNTLKARYYRGLTRLREVLERRRAGERS